MLSEIIKQDDKYRKTVIDTYYKMLIKSLKKGILHRHAMSRLTDLIKLKNGNQ